MEILCSIREMVYHINQENNSNEVGLMFMLLKKKFDESYNNRQIGRIRKDLIANLRKMGVEVSNIQIDLDENNVSLRLSIPEKRYSSIPSE